MAAKDTGRYKKEETRTGKEDRKDFLKISLDIGTTFSTWCYCFDHDYNRHQNSVRAKNWQSENRVSEKAPTAVLIEPCGKKFHSFGYSAQRKYAELCEKNVNKATEWFFFYRFKMNLHRRTSIQDDEKLEDISGKTLNAKYVFTKAIWYLKNDAIESIRKGTLIPSIESYIQWILTVPAIWTDTAKSFMKSAAREAGIPPERLEIVIEPETAAVYCRNLPIDGHEGDCLKHMQRGSAYAVLDAGGGTVDMTVHEIIDADSVHEIHKACGGDWGGTRVDEAIEEFIEDIFGRGILKELKEKSMEEYLDLCEIIELKKREISSSKTITIIIGYALRQLSKSKSGRSLEEAVANSKYEGKVIAHNDKLRVDPSVTVSWFDYSVKSTVAQLSEMLGKTAMSNCSVILMVGGLSQSIVLQNAVKKTFTDKKVVIPPEAELSVSKGAVQFAYNPLFVKSRIVKYTYGTDITHKYIKSCSHKVGLRELDKNGDMRCYDNFVLIVKEGTSVPVDDVVDGSLFGPIVKTQNSIRSEIFISTSPDTELTTDSSCTKIGQVTFKIREEDFEKGCIYKHIYKFGGTEIKITTMNTELDEEMGEETEVEFKG
ncbi:heat shock 70 kDa protein 12A-like [Mya arenaria]|uniref:heat shock 70 kDa protein 12A-like n=1 Tax=Mya arenaria TaxID=6604 RepID=UPI0022E5CABF|nr:heat shock 70 kDa protein 12A-like [Mya arenaria]